MILEFYGEHNIPYIKDLFKRMKRSDKYRISFKNCGLSTFYKLLKSYGYVKRNSQKVC